MLKLLAKTFIFDMIFERQIFSMGRLNVNYSGLLLIFSFVTHLLYSFRCLPRR